MNIAVYAQLHPKPTARDISAMKILSRRFPLKKSPAKETATAAAQHTRSRLFGIKYLESTIAAVNDKAAVASLRISFS